MSSYALRSWLVRCERLAAELACLPEVERYGALRTARAMLQNAALGLATHEPTRHEPT